MNGWKLVQMILLFQLGGFLVNQKQFYWVHFGVKNNDTLGKEDPKTQKNRREFDSRIEGGVDLDGFSVVHFWNLFWNILLGKILLPPLEASEEKFGSVRLRRWYFFLMLGR